MELAAHHPKEFIEQVELRFKLDSSWKGYLKLIKEGARADKTFDRKNSLLKPGDWIVVPYAPRLVSNVLAAIKRGKLKEKE